MRAVAWGIVAAAGFVQMVATHRGRMAIDASAPWASAVMAVGQEAQEPPDAPEGASALRTRSLTLPLSDRARSIVDAMARDDSEARVRMESIVGPRLVELPDAEIAGLAPWLRSGRLPARGAAELLAGADVEKKDGDEMQVGGGTFQVVGVLKPDVALFARSYLVPPGRAFDEADLQNTALIRPADRNLGRDPGLGVRIAATYPSDRFTLYTPRIRPGADAFRLYLAGQALFLLGGSGLLIGLYRRLATREGNPILSAALREVAARPGLIWAVHLAYFGLYFAGSLASYAVPEVGAILMSNVAGELGDKGQGPLAIAGTAYRSGNIPYAALVTFLVNFPLGSLAMITLPSLIVPGSGVLISIVRATSWGLLLGPTEGVMAGRMIPHSGTLLLEGEGYILATFFALLVPIFLFGRAPIRKGPESDPPAFDDDLEPPSPKREGFRERYARAAAINLKGSVLVAIVLAVAACYEAVEVIRMAGL